MAAPAVIEIRHTDQNGNVVTLSPVSWSRERSPVLLRDAPRMTATLRDESGVTMRRLKHGDNFDLYRNGKLAFIGAIEDIEKVANPSGRIIKVTALHRAWCDLQRETLTTYDFDEDGEPAPTRDGVTRNPNQFTLLRLPGGDLQDLDGLPEVIDGVPFEDGIRHLYGRGQVIQVDFQDNSTLLPSQVGAAGTKKAQVYTDEPTGDVRPGLQAVQGVGSGVHNDVRVDTIPLLVGDWNTTRAKTIRRVSLVLYGTGEQDPNLIEICRDAVNPDGTNNQNRTYTNAGAITRNDMGGYIKWTVGTNTFADLPGQAVRNAVGVRIRFENQFPPATASGFACKIWYMRITCEVDDEETGTFETYSDSAGTFIEGDFNTMTRLEALSRVQEMTTSDSDLNPSPHWDMWFEPDSTDLNFAERRGSNKSKVWSFKEKNLLSLDELSAGGEIAYQTIAYGAGAGTAQNRIVSTREFLDGGLYDFANDPRTLDLPSALDESGNELHLQRSGDPEVAASITKYGAGAEVLFNQVGNPEQVYYSTRHSEFSQSGDFSAFIVFNIPAFDPTFAATILKSRADGGGNHYEVVIGTDGKISYDHGKASNFIFVTSASAISTGINRMWIKRDAAAKNVKIRVNGVTYIDHTYTTTVPDLGVGLLQVVSVLDGAVHEFRFWDSLVADATLDTMADDTLLGAANYEQTAEGTETGLYFFEAHKPRYGTKPRQMNFIDAAQNSAVQLFRSARAQHKLHREPRRSFRLKIKNENLPYFDVGDGIRVKDITYDIDETLRVISLRESGDGNGEDWDMVVGQPEVGVINKISGATTQVAEVATGGVTLPTSASAGASGNGVYFDADHFGVDRSIVIPEGVQIDRVLVKITTNPWVIHSRMGFQTSEDTKTVTGQVINAGATHSDSITLPGQGMTTMYLAANTIASSTDFHSRAFITANAAILASSHSERTSGTTDPRHAACAADTNAQTSPLKAEIQIKNLAGSNQSFNYTIKSFTADRGTIFGVWRFDGDGGTGDGNPLYGTGILVSIDPALQASGLPSAGQFTTKQHPIIFGAEASPQTVILDVTNYLDADSNGIIKPGEHLLFFDCGTTASNSKGLCVVSVSPIYRYRVNK